MEPTRTQMNQISLAHYGIDLNIPPEQPQVPAANANPVPGVAPEVVPNPPPRASQSELNRLMQTIARQTYSEVTSAELKNAKKLDSSDRTTLKTLAAQAERTLAAIKNLTVRDILNTNDNTVEELFKAAADSQFELANALREIAIKPKYQTEKFAGYRQMLDDFSLKCDARASEILTLFMEVTTFGQAQAIGNGSQLTAASADDLLKGMAGSMHGNDKSLVFKAETDAIEARLAQFAASTTVKPEDLNALLTQTETLSAKLKAADVAATMDPQIHAQLTARLDALRADVSARTEKALTTSANGLFKSIINPTPFYTAVSEYISTRKKKFPQLHAMLQLLNRIHAEGLRDASDIAKLDSFLTTRNVKLFAEIANLLELLRKNNPEVKRVTRADIFFKMLGVPPHAYIKAKAVRQELQNRATRGPSFLSGEDIISAFRQDSKLSLLLETRINGGNDANVNSQFCDANLVSSVKLGSGSVNTVYKMTYKMEDGSTKDFVFKPDITGRAGLEGLLIGDYSSYKNTQQTVKLNAATSDVAEFLGLGRFVGKTYATLHNGQYGLLMEMAPGKEAAQYEGELNKEIRQKFWKREIVGKLAKELNDLRWLDIATGQGDRHNHNYLLDFGTDGKTPKVTGIDNDMCFTTYLIGVGKFKVDHTQDRYETFLSQLREACTTKNPRKPQDSFFDQAKYDSLIKEIENNNFVVDVKNAPNEVLYAVRMGFGFHSITTPKQMSRGLHDKLVALTDEQILKLAEKLNTNVDDPNAVDATVQRLKDMREIAKEYERDGKIVEDTAWETDRNVLNLERESVVAPTGDYNVDVQIGHCTESFLQRDFKLLIILLN